MPSLPPPIIFTITNHIHYHQSYSPSLTLDNRLYLSEETVASLFIFELHSHQNQLILGPSYHQLCQLQILWTARQFPDLSHLWHYHCCESNALVSHPNDKKDRL